MQSSFTESHGQFHGVRVRLRQLVSQYYPPLKGGLYRETGSMVKKP